MKKSDAQVQTVFYQHNMNTMKGYYTQGVKQCARQSVSKFNRTFSIENIVFTFSE